MTVNLAVNGASLLSPLTGVGRYTYHLLGEIEKSSDFQPYFFYREYWAEQRLDKASSGGQGKALRTDWLKKQLRTYVPYSYDMARRLRQRTFDGGVRRHGIQLYHEPNFIPFRFNGPTVTTIHDLSILRYPETHPRERVRVIGKKLSDAVERSNFIIADSEFIAREIVETFAIDASRVRAIHIGVDNDFRPRSEMEVKDCLARHGLAYGRYLLAVGTLEPRKNIASLIKAYRLLPPRVRHRFPLVIVGMKGWRHGDVNRDMEALVSTGEIKLLGYLSDEELPQLYAGSTMLVYPSVYEGFGLPPLEAMASGVPVITSDRSSLPEVVGDAGVLVKPYDIDGMAEAIAGLIEDAKERERRGLAGRKRAQDFTWSRCAQETMNVYRQALNA